MPSCQFSATVTRLVRAAVYEASRAPDIAVDDPDHGVSEAQLFDNLPSDTRDREEILSGADSGSAAEREPPKSGRLLRPERLPVAGVGVHPADGRAGVTRVVTEQHGLGVLLGHLDGFERSSTSTSTAYSSMRTDV